MARLAQQYMGVADAEAMTGISRWTWRKKAYSGAVSSTKVGRRLLIPVSEIERILGEGFRPAEAQQLWK